MPPHFKNGTMCLIRSYWLQCWLFIQNKEAGQHFLYNEICMRVNLLILFQLPIDISKLSPEEQAALRRRRKPKTEIKVEKEIEDNYDRKKYVNFLKKKWCKSCFKFYKECVTLPDAWFVYGNSLNNSSICQTQFSQLRSMG